MGPSGMCSRLLFGTIALLVVRTSQRPESLTIAAQRIGLCYRSPSHSHPRADTRRAFVPRRRGLPLAEVSVLALRMWDAQLSKMTHHSSWRLPRQQQRAIPTVGRRCSRTPRRRLTAVAMAAATMMAVTTTTVKTAVKPYRRQPIGTQDAWAELAHQATTALAHLAVRSAVTVA